MTTLAQRIGQEFKTLRDNELSLKAEQTVVDAEITRATNSENTLQVNIDAEVTRATDAESTLTANLNSEITARISADTTLQTAIDSKIDGNSGTLGDILYHNGASFVKLAPGTEGQILRIGSSGIPEWADPLIE